jgi:adenine-specific DNA-methyltransferase
MTMDFLGHKESLLGVIMAQISQVIRPGEAVADLFCGTASVSIGLKAAGFNVVANDHLLWCSTFAEAILLNGLEPSFAKLPPPFRTGRKTALVETRYDAVLAHLNRIAPQRGFITANYSPVSGEEGTVTRMYFTESNARRIDAIRQEIETWTCAGYLSRGEKALLIRDLLRAANAVSNTAGTYGSYLKQWKCRALESLILTRSRLVAGCGQHEVYQEDANVLVSSLAVDAVYADPPYTKRQYAAYYHVLETIAAGDQPAITGSTGLRPWKDKSSAYCLRRTAPSALSDLVNKLNCRHLFLSYNEDGQISHSTIVSILSARGLVSVQESPYRRYKSSMRPHKGNQLMERLYHLTLDPN